MTLAKYLALSEPVFSAVEWDNESHLLGVLRHPSEIQLYRALSQCPCVLVASLGFLCLGGVEEPERVGWAGVLLPGGASSYG